MAARNGERLAMRMAVFSQLRSPWSRQTALRLAELGHQIHFIDFTSSGDITGYLQSRDDVFAADISRFSEQVAGIHLINAPFSNQVRYITCAAELRRICKECDAAILLTLWGGGWATMSYLSGMRPYAVFVGGGDILRVAGVNKWVSAFALRRASIVFANGRYFGEKARQFAPRAKIFPLYYGVDTQRFSPADSPSSPLRIICTRGFSSPYNNAYLIEALALLPRDLPEYRVTFTSAGELLKQAQSLADRILPDWLRRRVEFLNGVTDDMMVACLKNSHIYVSLSRYDGTSISLLEALSCGLFPVLSDIPQNREWIEPSLYNGLLVSLNHPQKLADALALALSDDESRTRARTINRRMILDRADGRKNMTVLAYELEKIVEARCNDEGTKLCL